jgi:hypothetical protein
VDFVDFERLEQHGVKLDKKERAIFRHSIVRGC